MIKGYEVDSFSHSSFFNKWIVPGGIYVALSSGAGNPIRCDESLCEVSEEYFAFMAILLLITPFIRVNRSVLFPIIILIFGFLILGVIGYASSMPLFVFSKAWGAFMASGFAFIFMHHLIQHTGLSGLAQGFVRIMLTVLGLTLLFKAAQGGLMDRGVLFILNGPIVFGWLMGVGALCSIYILSLKRNLINFLIVIGLSLAVIWSGSKGPIIAYFLSAIFMYVYNGGFRVGKVIQVWLFSILVVLVIIQTGVIEEILESRIGTLFDVFNNGIDYSEGSVGVRLASYQTSLELISENLFSGIGSGVFAEYEPKLMYPHNVHLEILLEYGLVIFVFYALLLIRGVVYGSLLIRSVIIFFVICMSFSGDVSMLRYLLPFLLINIFPQYQVARRMRLDFGIRDYFRVMIR